MSKFHNAPNRSKPLVEAFHEKYVKDDLTGCWNWVASRMKTGYGLINTRNGKVVTAHRFSYRLHKGEIPDGLFVCHACDNRACVNPDHLWLGTCDDNLRDMREKGRARNIGARGEKNGSAKLTEADVLEIFSSQEAQKLLSEKFGITQAAVSAIQNGKTWKHVTKAMKPINRKPQFKLTERDVREIYSDQRAQCEIAKSYGVRHSIVSRIKSGERWQHITKNLRKCADA